MVRDIPSLKLWETFLWCSFGTRFWLSVPLIESSFNEKTTIANENFLGLSVCLSSAARNFRPALDANRKTIESSFSGILPKEFSVTEPIHTIRHLIGLLVAANSKSAKPNSPSLNKQSIWTKMVRTFSLSLKFRLRMGLRWSAKCTDSVLGEARRTNKQIEWKFEMENSSIRM